MLFKKYTTMKKKNPGTQSVPNSKKETSLKDKLTPSLERGKVIPKKRN